MKDGLTVSEVAKRLSLPHGTLKNWVYVARQGLLAAVVKNQTLLAEVEMELARVKRDLAELKMQRDQLKNAAAYFAKESW